ncbi:MAG: hypothetical protein WBG86_15310 [Polyangiales bacterium]
MREKQFGGVTVRLTGGPDREGGGDGPVVVLMHGFGAPGTDLVGLWRVLDVPRDIRFAFPEAPHGIPGMPGARAWWMVDMESAAQALEGAPRDYAEKVPPGMEDATDLVVQMLVDLRQTLDVPESRLVVGGFSQGSMAACNAVFTRDVKPAGLAVLSGTPVNLAAWSTGMPERQVVPVFQSHGRRDPILSFEAAEVLRDTMTGCGLDVRWSPFGGGHELPASVIEGLGAFISDRLSDKGSNS